MFAGGGGGRVCPVLAEGGRSAYMSGCASKHTARQMRCAARFGIDKPAMAKTSAANKQVADMSNRVGTSKCGVVGMVVTA